MGNWQELARGIAIDGLKVLGSWVAESSRARAFGEDSVCKSSHMWLQDQVSSCQQRLGIALGKRECTSEWIILLSGFISGIVFSLICFAAWWLSSGRSLSLKGEPVAACWPKELPVLPRKLSHGGSSSEELANARLRARTLHG